MKAAIYARVSTTEQSTENQVQMCRDYCARNGIEIFKTYTDDGVSGAKSSRPAFDGLLQDMRLVRFNCIVVAKLDRIGRSLQHLMSLFEEFKVQGVHFISITQNINTSDQSATSKLQLQMIGVFAEFERNLISERTKDGMRGKKNVGKRGPDKRPRKLRGGLRKRLEF
jgi:DNA invertase Pin-like site-specific DNA recombinase